MHKEHDPLIQLSEATGRVVGNTSVSKVAAIGYLQSTITQAGLQALVDILIQKGVVSREAMNAALNEQYYRRYEQLSGSNGAIVGAAPSAKAQ
jgi:hypothetical protein